MKAALEKTGYTQIRRCHFNDSRDDAFRQVEELERFIDEKSGLEECAMEAIKPEIEPPSNNFPEVDKMPEVKILIDPR
jgi:hypothetical protein